MCQFVVKTQQNWGPETNIWSKTWLPY